MNTIRKSLSQMAAWSQSLRWNLLGEKPGSYCGSKPFHQESHGEIAKTIQRNKPCLAANSIRQSPTHLWSRAGELASPGSLFGLVQIIALLSYRKMKYNFLSKRFVRIVFVIKDKERGFWNNLFWMAAVGAAVRDGAPPVTLPHVSSRIKTNAT